jgi:hypothetical protein
VGGQCSWESLSKEARPLHLWITLICNLHGACIAPGFAEGLKQYASVLGSHQLHLQPCFASIRLTDLTTIDYSAICVWVRSPHDPNGRVRKLHCRESVPAESRGFCLTCFSCMSFINR